MDADRCCSLTSLLEAGGDTHPWFCLQRQLHGETHTCQWSSPDLSCSCCSSSLFDSSLVSETHKDDIPVVVPITPQHICTDAVMITPAMKKVHTPANIRIETDKLMWTQSMATPTCQRHQSPAASEGWSTETSPQSDVGSSSSRLRNSARGKEPLARVLFGRESQLDSLMTTQPFNSALDISPLVLNTHHGLPVSRREPIESSISGSPRLDLSSTILVECSQELFDSPRISPSKVEEEEGEGEEVLIEDRTVLEQVDCNKELSVQTNTSNSNLDVLFLGNSQLEWSDLKENAAPDAVTEQPSPVHTSITPHSSPHIVSLHSDHQADKNTPKSFQYFTPLPSPIAVQTNDQLYSNASVSTNEQLQPSNSHSPENSTSTENNRKRLSDGNESIAQLKKSKREDCCEKDKLAVQDNQQLDLYSVVPVVTKSDLSSANPHCSTPGLPPVRAFTSFKTPTVAAPIRQSNSCPSRRVLSAKRKNVRPFRTPRSAKSVSKEEEAVSIARIMQQFGRPIPNEVAIPQPIQSTSPKSCASGFTTAGGRNLSVSTAAVRRAKQLIEPETDEVINPTSSVSVGFSTASGKKLSVSTSSMERAHTLTIDNSYQPSNDPLTYALHTGFTTPSGKRLSVSAAAMEKAHKLTTDDASATALKRDSPTGTLPTGFTTPSGKKLSVSAAAMERAHTLTTNYLTDATACNAALPTGFSTPSGKKLSVGAAAMQRARELITPESLQINSKGMEIAPDSSLVLASRPPTHQLSFASGFQTPSGKTITISSDSMTKAMGLCAELRELNETITDYGQLLVCEKEDAASLQTKSMDEEELELQDIDMDTFGNFTQLSVVDPSTSPVNREGNQEEQDEDTNLYLEQLEMSHLDIFSEEEDRDSSQPMAPPQNGSMASDDNTVTSDNIGSSCLGDLFECQTLVDLSFPHPSQHSGSGKVVTGADCSVEEKNDLVIKTKQDDSCVPCESTESHRHDECISQEGATGTQPMCGSPLDTASGSMVALQQKDHTRKVTSGLQTASGNTQSTLEHVPHKRVASGLQTAGGQSVSVSLDSLEHARYRLSDDQSTGRMSSGLQTAAGDKVTVKVRSMEHVQRKSSSQPFPGLTTAAGNHVPVSQKALQAVRRQERGGGSRPLGLVDHNASNITTSSLSVIPRSEPVVTSCAAEEERHTIQKGSTRPSYSLTTTPEGTLYDRHSSSRPLYSRGITPYSKRFLKKPRTESTCRQRLVEPVQTPAPSSLPSSSPRSHSTPYRRQVTPVWRGSLRASLPQHSAEPSSPPLSPINLTMSQLDTLLDTALTQCDPPLPPPSHSDSGFCSGERKTASANSSMQSPVNRKEASLCVRPQAGSLLQQRQTTCPLPLSRLINGRRNRLIRYTHEQLSALGVSRSVMGVSIENAPQFVFRGLESFSLDAVSRGSVCVGDGVCLQLTQEGDVGVQELWRAFRSSLGVDRQLISVEWFANHYQWLVWKLATMEVCFPEVLGGRCLNPDWLMVQMKYRYDREIDRAERSVLHKVCEGDESSTRPMVLCVSKCLATHHNATEQTPCLELTDGWYSMPAAVDAPLHRLMRCGRVTVGTKLFVCGAELGGSSELCHPLQVKGSRWLKLSANSTRRAHWAARLGLHCLSQPPTFPLSSLYIDGGMVPAVKVVVSRVYPLLYMEKLHDGTNVFRNSKAEQTVARKWEEERQKLVEQVYQQEQQQFESELANEERASCRRRSRRMNMHQLKQLSDGEEIHQAIKMSSDPETIQEQLSRTQRALLESYQLSLAAQQQASLQERISRALKEKASKIPEDRHVVPLLRLCVVQYGDTVYNNVDCTVSVWRPAQCVLELLCEGQGVLLSHLTASASRYRQGRLQLSAMKTTAYQPLVSDPSQVVNYHPRQYVPISQLGVVELPHREFDTAGLVVCVTGANGGRPVDQVFLAHSSGSVLRVNVWEGLKSMEADNVVSVGCVVAASNLRLLERSRCLTTASAGDTAVFQQHPTNSHLVDGIKQLTISLPEDVSQFIEDLQNKLLVR